MKKIILLLILMVLIVGCSSSFSPEEKCTQDCQKWGYLFYQFDESLYGQDNCWCLPKTGDAKPVLVPG